MSPLAQQIFTPEEYLRLERAAETKSELIDGRIYAMVGASFAHNAIVFNLAREFGAQLRGGPCRAFVNDMRVKVRRTGMYTYPDFVALCEEPQLEDNKRDTLLNPSVVIEVLSDSTETYDRGEKFAHYRKLDSLREYILIAQNLPRAEQYIRDGEFWTFKAIEGLEATLSIETLGCTLSLADIYEQVEFPAPEDRKRR